MTRAQFRVLILLTVISGLVGGGLSDWLFRGLPARAAQSTVALQVIEAQEFRLVDAEGNMRARLGYDKQDGMAALCLWDSAGKLRAYVGNMTTVEYDEVGGKTTTVNPGFQVIPASGDTFLTPLP